jgi:dTDP-4-dehydrorhamnose 3,5-epimerase-like enzyme
MPAELCATTQAAHPLAKPAGSRLDLRVRGCFLLRLPSFRDLRGAITVVESDGNLPFLAARVFFVYGVPSQSIRGAHAHRTCAQVLFALTGSVVVSVDDGIRNDRVCLNEPTTALYVPPMIWSEQSEFQSDTVLTVIASHKYDPDDYVRRRSDFLQMMIAPNE